MSWLGNLAKTPQSGLPSPFVSSRNPHSAAAVSAGLASGSFPETSMLNFRLWPSFAMDTLSICAMRGAGAGWPLGSTVAPRSAIASTTPGEGRDSPLGSDVWVALAAPEELPQPPASKKSGSMPISAKATPSRDNNAVWTGSLKYTSEKGIRLSNIKCNKTKPRLQSSAWRCRCKAAPAVLLINGNFAWSRS